MFDKNKPYNSLPLLPGNFDFNQSLFLKLAIKATEEISKLNGVSSLIPNLKILISPLLIKESVESSAIENINTTTLKVLESGVLDKNKVFGAEKEVLSYHEAILYGVEKLEKQGGISSLLLTEIQSIIEPNKTGIRAIPGTVIANGKGEAVYTPPDGKENISKLLSNLEKFINNEDDDINALIKMPVIHYQFESIHPFYDGNGRTGRILNILFLVLAKKLDYPILFLSEYINQNKNKYYNILNKTSKTGNYSDIIIYFLEGIIIQAKKTTKKIHNINNLRNKIELLISDLNLDSSKITKILFSHPFLTVGGFRDKMGFSQSTMIRTVKILENKGVISSKKIGRNKLIFIKEFIEILS